MMRFDTLRVFAVLITMGNLPGCSSGESVISDEDRLVVIPLMFDEGETSWEQEDGMTDPDKNRLTTYFRKNPSVAEHSIVHGDPLVYATGDKLRRYYWVRPGADGAEWFCLEFGDREVSLKDGHGSPFLGG